MGRIRFFKILCGIGFLVVLVSNVWTISGCFSSSRSCAFAAAFTIGMVPTLIANLINAGSPFSTTYGVDVAPPEINANVLLQYFADVQFILLVIAALWTVLILRFDRRSGARAAGLAVAGNLLLNLLFFMTHPVFTPYYTVPVVMLSLWTLLFATLGENSRQGRTIDLMEGPKGLRL